MELAGRIYDVVTDTKAISEEIRDLLPQAAGADERAYWRRVVRMAALCHDLGHLPFSHAAEAQLLPDGWDHERMTVELIHSDEMKEIWNEMRPALVPSDIAKIAVGPKKAQAGVELSDWEAILSEIIVGDVFGADRIDYLLRDSYHAGVAYGRFDHYRLIDTLRILPPPPVKKPHSAQIALLPEDSLDESLEPSLGVELGGLQAAEALLLARYFMYSQVYFHSVRRIYDKHLVDFLQAYLDGGKFSTDLDEYLALTDIEVTAALRERAFATQSPGYDPASRIVRRKHFRVVFQPSPEELKRNKGAAHIVGEALSNQFSPDLIWSDTYTPGSQSFDFSVLMDDRTVSALSLSQVMQQVPAVFVNRTYAAPEIRDAAKAWVKKNLDDVI
jgi:HD superfamily phosphohydrolase